MDTKVHEKVENFIYTFDIETYGDDEEVEGNFGPQEVYAMAWGRVDLHHFPNVYPVDDVMVCVKQHADDDVIDIMMSKIIEDCQAELCSGRLAHIHMFSHNGGRFDTLFVRGSHFIERATTRSGWKEIHSGSCLLSLSAWIKVREDGPPTLRTCKVDFRDSLASMGHIRSHQ